VFKLWLFDRCRLRSLSKGDVVVVGEVVLAVAGVGWTLVSGGLGPAVASQGQPRIDAALSFCWWRCDPRT
jgi:hypothetical protein